MSASLPVRFALPPSLGQAESLQRARHLESYLSNALLKTVQVVVSAKYDTLAKDLLAGRIDVAWAPPFVCARVEAMGVRVLVRGVRQGASSYRAALVARRGAGVTLSTLAGKRAVWVDKDSVGGYLLAMAHFRAHQLDASALLLTQRFAGSYRLALDAVLANEADLTSVFWPKALSADRLEHIDGLLENAKDALDVVALTDESPNDGVAISVNVQPELAAQLERTLLALHGTAHGVAILKDIFNVESFEAAPRLGYRALYRVALASL